MSAPLPALDAPNLPRLAEAASALARQAGHAIMDVYAHAFEVQHKDDRSPLTEADLAAHRILVAGLALLTPEWPVLSEESAVTPWPERAGWSRYWLVDPLDGTREFIKRNGEFTVNIALIDRHEPVIGIVHAPASGVSWLAWHGGGSWREDASGAQEMIHVRRPANAPLTVAASRSHLDPRTAALLDRLGPSERIGLGSSLKFCRIAEGTVDLYPRFGPTSEWDTAAGQCVVEQAGGGVFRLDGTPLRYNTKDALLNPDFIALGDARLHWQDWIA